VWPPTAMPFSRTNATTVISPLPMRAPRSYCHRAIELRAALPWTPARHNNTTCSDLPLTSQEYIGLLLFLLYRLITIGPWGVVHIEHAFSLLPFLCCRWFPLPVYESCIGFVNSVFKQVVRETRSDC
jgi:hypothetical protein